VAKQLLKLLLYPDVLSTLLWSEKGLSKKKNQRKFRWWQRVLSVIAGLIIVAVVAVATTNILVVKTGEDNIVSATEAGEHGAQAILVLGAAVYADGTPSGVLRDRLDVAIDLYFAGAAPKIIMSGDNATLEYNEVLAMKNYAISKGVPSEDIFCDHAGFSTYESMYRAKSVFGVERMVVVTQGFHMGRALYSANGLGIDAVGVLSNQTTFEKQYVWELREIPARTKDFFFTLFKISPTFVGESIDLNQSGDITES
jgi:vancomycin permeability regulator SanA